MKTRYSIATARAQLSSLVDKVQEGGALELLRYGRPVAVLLSPQEYARLLEGRPGFSEAYERFVSEQDVGRYGLTDEELEELRDRAPGRDPSF